MKRYEASPTIAEYMLTYDQYKVNALLGPIGGGKTTGIIMTLLRVMHAQKPDANGVRRTRFAVVRNTRLQLKDSVIKSVHAWLPPNGSSVVYRETDLTQVFTYMLPDGTTVRSEWMFRSLDNEDDARKLLSVEYTAGWLSEFREIPFQLLTDLRSRMGRFPSMIDGGPTWSGVLCESNMPVEGSEWWKFLEVEQPPWMNRLIQPAAVVPDTARQGHWLLNPLAENAKWLEPGYYQNLAIGVTHYWMQSMLLCEYPPSLDGKAVYAQSYKKDRHVATQPLRCVFNVEAPPTLIVGIDQGRNPAAIITQLHPRGCLYVLRELIGENMGMDRFASELLRPLLATRDFAGLPVLCVIDPAGLQKSQVNDLTPADVLRQAGLRVIAAPTNDPLRRIEAVERHLQKHDGIQVDPSCVTLIEGLANAYKFRAKKNGELEDRPEKKHPISDVQDALQYACLVAGGVNYGRVISRPIGPTRTQKNPGVRAWT